MNLRRHPLFWGLMGVALLSAFILGLRWGLYLPTRDIQLMTYALSDPQHDPNTAPATAVLYPNGRFAVLTNHRGYVGQKLDLGMADAVFGAAEQASEHWATAYPTTGVVREVAVLHLTLNDGQSQTITIDNPLTNTGIPRSLRSFLASLTREQYLIARTGTPIDHGSLPLRFFATPLANTNDPGIYDLPDDYSITPLLAKGGYAAPSDDTLIQEWQLPNALMAPANSRVIRAGGQLYRFSVLVDWPALQ